MADITLTLTVPSGKVAIATEGYLTLYPNIETIVDPEWVDPEDGSPPDKIAKYTTKQWVQEKQLRLFIQAVHRGLSMKATRAARVTIDEDVATKS